ncbi:cathepsin L1-like [Colossoma macropomum]|uniref:cathepsin L1-like n=1 Tax=Colossoma macropomum TaxID=42526 RepID=UPI001864CDD1|nr:cathepsin L1-like [Colossoma macropomum]XP_036417056.1 cathepsin L1-like [Colossoma macropomum]
MRVLLAIATLVVVAGAASVSLEDLEFHAWKLKFGKSYGSVEEESQRKMKWLDNRKLVLEHNMLADQGIKSYRLGMNHFADMSDQEYEAMFKGCLISFNTTKTRSATPFLPQASGASLPVAQDWRSKGYVTGVKNQMECGSCWAFSATGALEAQMFKKTKTLVSLSEQQLVDCSFENGNNGCEGGSVDFAFMYIKKVGGLQTEESYSYENEEGTCRYNQQNAVATCSGFETVPEGDENALQSAVAAIGPVSVDIDTRRRTFKLYQSGVYDEQYCSDTILDHAVLVVGYDRSTSGQDYWLVKNSWGVNWGENGYIKMSRNKKNQCGIATNAVYPLV